jgi:hypothetical protein
LLKRTLPDLRVTEKQHLDNLRQKGLLPKFKKDRSSC